MAGSDSLGKLTGVYRVRPGVQHYAWGDPDFVPALLGIPNPDRRSYAELWMGAHPDLPAEVDLGERTVPLDRWIDEAAEAILGPRIAAKFARRLPYLLKVLAAEHPLSIQVHPSRQQAERGFARENAAGIPLAAPHRNYKDENHKPELIVALTDFYALRGFRPLDEIGEELSSVPEFRAVAGDFEPSSVGLERTYQRLMSLGQEEVDEALDPLLTRLGAAHLQRPFSRDQREYWLLAADRHFSRDGHHDQGLFSIFLLNLVHLRPGQALYLPAGILHAYLQGAGMEVMANSNNVLRGGLTSKHVDLDELLACVRFEGGAAEVLQPRTVAVGQAVYPAAAEEFELWRISLDAARPFESGPDHSADMVIVVDAGPDVSVTVASPDRELELKRGEVFFAPLGASYSLGAGGPATCFRATVPV